VYREENLMDHEMIRQIVSIVISKICENSQTAVHPKPFPIGVSNRHIHLSGKDVEVLFGAGHSINCERDLSQPGQCAASETVIIAGPRGSIEQVRVLGPVRSRTQVEISRGDTFHLGVDAPTRESGKLYGSCGLTVIGPAGSLQLAEGAIIAKRHIHMSPHDACGYGVTDSQTVRVRVDGERGVIYDNVVVRVSEKFVLEFHIDIDEANAAGIKQGDMARMICMSGCCGKDENAIPAPGGNTAKIIEEPILLVTEEIVRQVLRKKAVLVINKGVICTPLARDAIKELGVEVVWKLEDRG
jgi:putative phosphotransacetylase